MATASTLSSWGSLSSPAIKASMSGCTLEISRFSFLAKALFFSILLLKTPPSNSKAFQMRAARRWTSPKKAPVPPPIIPSFILFILSFSDFHESRLIPILACNANFQYVLVVTPASTTIFN